MTLTDESCHTYEWVMSRLWMSHGTHMNESWHTLSVVWCIQMCDIWICHVIHMKESWHTYEWVMAHIWMSHGTHMNEPCHTYEWVMPHIWMSHVTHMNESCHIRMCHDSFTYAMTREGFMAYRERYAMTPSRMQWLLHMWVMTHSYLRHDSFTCEPWLLYMWAMTPSHMWRSHMSHMWLLHMWAVTLFYLSHDSFPCLTWLLHWTTTHSNQGDCE